MAVGCVDGDHDDHGDCDDHGDHGDCDNYPDGDHGDHGDCDDDPDADHDDHGDCDDDPDVDDVDEVDYRCCNCCDSGGGAEVEAPLDWQQIQNDQKCIFTFYKNTI